jgi:hypothetical protein
MALVFQHAARLTLLTTLMVAIVMAQNQTILGTYVEDRDLSGCSVEMKGYIYNLQALQRS